MTPTAPLFLGFAGLVALAVILVAAWRFRARAAASIGIGLAVWLAYVGALSAPGLLRDPALRPPGIVYVVGPVFLFIVFCVARSGAGGRIAAAIPPVVADRVAELSRRGRAFPAPALDGGPGPQDADLRGRERRPLDRRLVAHRGVDHDAWTRRRPLALAWSVAGVLALANVVVRSVLKSPGPLRLLEAEVANRAVGAFPYTYIAGFLAPLAVALHVLALRAISARLAAHPATEEVTL